MTEQRMRIRTCIVNGSVIGDKNQAFGFTAAIGITPEHDEHAVLNIVRELMDEDFADNTVRLDAIHSVIHAAKRLGILPLRTV